MSRHKHEAPIVRLENICKSYGPVQANKDISLDIRATRILALLGENGAGKSTLMSILSGLTEQDSGHVLIDNLPARLRSPKDALNAGIGMVYQHFMLVDAMTVAENLALGKESGLLDPQLMAARVNELSNHYGLVVNPQARISSLSMGERQRVEILKLLYRNCRVLILDEPTAVLTPPEIEQLFAALRRMAEEGKAIVFISHKMKEVLDLAHEVAILRQGQVVDFFERAAVPGHRELAARMVGRPMERAVRAQPLPEGQPVLELHKLGCKGCLPLSLCVRQGGITAIVGVAGNGQRELVHTLTGLEPPVSGEVSILGHTWQNFFRFPPRNSGGMVYIPEDRKGLGVCPELNLVDNFLLTNRHCFSPGPFLNMQAAAVAAKNVAREYNVLPGDVMAKAASLSGGNLQKMVIGREFYRKPRLIIAENPTQGLDIAAMEEVWRRLLAAREHSGILLVSSDLSEALTLADYVAVMYQGRFMDVFPRSDQEKVHNIGLMMAGILPE